ncbi:MAG: hypothetical protein M3280_01760 [Actinomycetota bacterium]|nr:hypothetical protein [Actinomycetota bacterium]
MMELAIEFDSTFIEGAGAAAAAVLIFCGSVFFILMMVMGARLAYLVTASVTLAFVFIMAVIWSFTNPATPLGPVGELPQWNSVDVAEEADASELEGPSAAEYPDEPWRKIDDDDPEDTALSGELGSDAVNAIEDAAEKGDLPSETTGNTADTDSVRFLESDGTLYGGMVLEPAEGEEAPAVVVIMSFDPGNPLWEARKVLMGTTVLLVVHLVLLSLSERRAKRAREATP